MNEMRKEFYWTYWERPKRIIRGYVNRLFKWDNAILIQKEVNRHRNELVYFTPHLVVRLLGWVDKHDDDYYWVYLDGSKVRLLSCVGGFIWLKKRLSKFEYYDADYIFEINHPIESALDDIKKNGLKLK